MTGREKATRWALTLALVTGGTMPDEAAQGQESGFESMIQDMRDREYAEIRGKFMAVAEAMPADRYGFRAVAEIRSFGEEVNHAANVNFRLCGMAGGGNGRDRPRPEADGGEEPTAKADVVDRLRRSFELCDATLGSMTDAAALEPTFGRYIRSSHVTAMLGHAWHVYGKLTLLMRLNRLAPPGANPGVSKLPGPLQPPTPARGPTHRWSGS